MRILDNQNVFYGTQVISFITLLVVLIGVGLFPGSVHSFPVTTSAATTITTTTTTTIPTTTNSDINYSTSTNISDSNILLPLQNNSTNNNNNNNNNDDDIPNPNDKFVYSYHFEPLALIVVLGLFSCCLKSVGRIDLIGNKTPAELFGYSREEMEADELDEIATRSFIDSPEYQAERDMEQQQIQDSRGDFDRDFYNTENSEKSWFETKIASAMSGLTLQASRLLAHSRVAVQKLRGRKSNNDSVNSNEANDNNNNIQNNSNNNSNNNNNEIENSNLENNSVIQSHQYEISPNHSTNSFQFHEAAVLECIQVEMGSSSSTSSSTSSVSQTNRIQTNNSMENLQISMFALARDVSEEEKRINHSSNETVI